MKDRSSARLKFHYLVYLFIFSLPLYGFPFLNFQTRAIQWDWVILLLLIGLLTLHLFTGHSFKIYRNRIFVWLFIVNFFLILSALNPLLSMDSTHVVDFLTTWVQYVLCSAAFIVICSLKVKAGVLRTVLRVYLFTAFIVCLLGLIQFVGANLFGWNLYLSFPTVKFGIARSGYEFLLGGVKRATSIFAEPRHFGAFLILPFFISLATTLKRQYYLWGHRGFDKFLVALFGAGIIVSFSLSAFLAFAIALLIMPFVFRIPIQRVLAGLFLVLIIGISGHVMLDLIWDVNLLKFVAVRLLPSQYALNHLLNFDISLGGPPRYLRGAILAFGHLIHHPLTGIGLNQYYSMTPYDVTVLPPFDLMASLGLFGFTSFFVFVYLLLRNIDILRRRTSSDYSFFLDIAFIMVALSLVNSLFASRYNYPSTMFWFGLIVGGMIYFNVWRWSRESQESPAERKQHLNLEGWKGARRPSTCNYPKVRP